MPTLPPPYVEGHRLLEGRTVVITAAAGTGIGSAVARRCIEEGATILVSDAHERCCWPGGCWSNAWQPRGAPTKRRRCLRRSRRNAHGSA